MNQLPSTLFSVLNLLSDRLDYKLLNNNEITIDTNNKILFKCNDSEIKICDENISNLFHNQKSKLSDSIVNLKLITDFLIYINKKSSPVFFNHIGFCYQVASKKIERERLKKYAREKNFNIYEFPSNDAALWLFMGDKNNFKKPLLEYLPAEKVYDYYIDYWLPNIHIDIQTNLSVDDIKYSTHSIFLGQTRAHPSVVMDGIIYQQRIWLGVVSGINICLDIGTNEISMHQRRLYLKEI